MFTGDLLNVFSYQFLNDIEKLLLCKINHLNIIHVFDFFRLLSYREVDTTLSSTFHLKIRPLIQLGIFQ